MTAALEATTYLKGQDQPCLSDIHTEPSSILSRPLWLRPDTRAVEHQPFLRALSTVRVIQYKCHFLPRSSPFFSPPPPQSFAALPSTCPLPSLCICTPGSLHTSRSHLHPPRMSVVSPSPRINNTATAAHGDVRCHGTSIHQHQHPSTPASIHATSSFSPSRAFFFFFFPRGGWLGGWCGMWRAQPCLCRLLMQLRMSAVMSLSAR